MPKLLYSRCQKHCSPNCQNHCTLNSCLQQLYCEKKSRPLTNILMPALDRSVLKRQ